ncbi:MAG TPA: AEC family transporter [Roseiflexaceae bacterium]|jgi:predicted permease|nr:AEC family transporter [Roseiflexaceae bacterium]
MILSAFVEVLLPVIVVVGCGYALRRTLPLDLRSLNRVSLYVLSPALIFVTLIRIDVTGGEAVRVAGLSVLLIFALGALTLLCARPLRLNRPTVSALLLAIMFMNAGNYGLPTARFAFGEDGFQRALLFYLPQTILSQVMAIVIAQAGSGDWKIAVQRIFRMPQVYAAAAGLLLRFSGLKLEGRTDALGGIFSGFVLMSEATLPLLLLLLGMQLAQGVAIEERGLTTMAVGLRLLASPLLALGLALLLGMDDLSLRVAVLEAGMPTAVNMVLFSLEFDARPRFVAGVTVASTLLSLATLTFTLALLRM